MSKMTLYREWVKLRTEKMLYLLEETTTTCRMILKLRIILGLPKTPQRWLLRPQNQLLHQSSSPPPNTAPKDLAEKFNAKALTFPRNSFKVPPKALLSVLNLSLKSFTVFLLNL
jgi:hypothetical protein